MDRDAHVRRWSTLLPIAEQAARHPFGPAEETGADEVMALSMIDDHGAPPRSYELLRAALGEQRAAGAGGAEAAVLASGPPK